MNTSAKNMLARILDVLAWGFLSVGGTLVAYGIYGRFTVRVGTYGPLGAPDFMISAFWIAVAIAGFWGLKRLAGHVRKNGEDIKS